MRFYSMTDKDVLSTQISRFWLLARNISRITAEEDLRSLTIANVATSGERTKEYRDKLIAEIGTVSVIEEARDESGIARLKAMSGDKTGSIR